MALTAKSRSKLKNFIRWIAHRAKLVYPSQCQDVDDYIQVGDIALWRIEQQWDSDDYQIFMPYALLVIAREIRRAAIEASFAVSASYRAKIQAIQMQAQFAAGMSEAEVRRRSQTITKWGSVEEWISLRGMMVGAAGDDALLAIADDVCPTYSAFDDILSITALTKEEKRALRIAMGEKDKWNKSSAAFTRAINRTHEKLVRGGY